ncbi:cellulase family glycosylhydrolase [Draconibacterium sp. IB214405]|uniref:cellulase family glycosylhydrolase n=1 Tax=Draconibacterium sp. IB214405 TaxID=3097352 RepID=UPI002A146C6A|nr:cellulase family glycosylhydrolase [Draconibacterium sp. IB214405]MDX8340309.1 cellulase family glycosylhydrolase [Draconibacterium sp. IB214405]
MKTLFCLLFLVTSVLLSAQNREKAFEINEKLGRGVNFGNMFEAPTETEWGNPWKPQYPGIVADLGFNHIRIPIRWEPAERSSSTDPYTINTVFLNRIKQVVDSTLNNGLYAIINMHHHEALYDDPDGQKARFLAQWKQISEFFADYPDQLLFEILNEPHGNLDAATWNTLFSDALTTIREDNPERVVLIGTAEYGGLGGLSKLEFPNDDNIIVTVHYYNPFSFTHQGAEWSDGSDAWLGTEWTDTETERQIVQNEFAPLKALEQEKNIPVHVGEFGSYNKADMDSRERWTTYIARFIESQRWSWAYWEFSAGFGIYNPSDGTYNDRLVDALLHNEMPEPAKYVGTPVYTSQFDQTISEWNLSANNGAEATLAQNGGNLDVNITTASTQGWHIQLVKNNVVLEAGKKYRLTFKAKSTADRIALSYVGMNVDPWSSYSGYNSISLTDTFNVYSFVFDMTTTDNNARIVFDLGTASPDISFEYVTLESVELQFPTAVELIKNVKSRVFPNPVQEKLCIDNTDDFQQLTITDVYGQIFKQNQLTNQLNEISVNELSSGIYFVTLSNQSNRHTVKIIKK